MDNVDKSTIAGTSSSNLPHDKSVASDSLSDVYKSVADAFTPNVRSPGQASSSAPASPSFTQFLHTLVKSDSDKADSKRIQERIGSYTGGRQ